MKSVSVVLLVACLSAWTTTLQSATHAISSDLQSSINFAQSGDTIVLAPGVYEATPVEFVDTLCGNCAEHKTRHHASYGYHIADKNLWIVGSGDSTVLITGAGYGVFFDNCREGGIRNVAITGGIRDTSGMATDAAIVVRNGRITVQECLIRDNTDYPDSIIVGIGGIMGRERAELIVLNNRIINSTWDGIALYRGATAYIADNIIHKGRGAGIGITWDASATVVRNQVSNYWKGIGSFGSTRVLCYNNIVYNLLGWGITATGTSYMDCANNIIYQNGNCGFGLWGMDVHGRFTNNVIVKNGWREQWVCGRVGFQNYGHPSQFSITHNVQWENVEGDWRDMPDYTGIGDNFHLNPVWDTLTFRPFDGSPLINNGNPELSDPDGSPCDIGIYGGPHAFLKPVDVKREAPIDTRKKK